LRLANQVVDEIKRHFEDIVYNTIIHRNTRLGEAPSFGKPAIMYDAESKGSINYMTLVREMLQRNNDTNIPNSNKEFNLAVDEETEDVADLN
jgi:chromosome partitioning protein